MSTRMLHIFNGLLLVALFLGSAWVFDDLPDTIPMHFGPTGEPDAYLPTGFWSWFLLPLISLLVTLLLYVIARLIPRRPHLLNVPHQKRFDALPPDARREVATLAQPFLHRLTGLTLLLLGTLQWEIYRVAMEMQDGLSEASLIAFIAFLVITGVLVIRFIRETGHLMTTLNAQDSKT